MNEYAQIWQFTRERLRAAYQDLNPAQLTWKPYAGGHGICEYLLHVAGAEHYWAARLVAKDPRPTEFEAKLDRAVREGFITEVAFPFGPEELTLRMAEDALQFAYDELAPIIEKPKAEQLEMRIESPLGPVVSGREGLWRVCQHAAYHTGQIWHMRLNPDFPR